MPWIFVYDTLMRGMPNHHLLQEHMVQCLKATIKGKLYHLPKGYPIIIEGGYWNVHGEAIKIHENSSLLGMLDELEGYFGPGNPDNKYERVEKEVHLPDMAWKVSAIVYVCPEEKRNEIIKTGLLVNGGDWRKFIETYDKD